MKLPNGYRRNLQTPLRILGRYASTSAPDIVSSLKARGLVAQVTSDSLDKACANPITVYSGVDPSARSLHIGNLLPLITLLHFGLRGHKPIALIGGATGSIGDPGGRATERKLLSKEELDFNVSRITSQVHGFFKTATEYASRRQEGLRSAEPIVVNNLDWFQDVRLLDFLRSIGKHAKVNTMISRDSVSSRLNAEQGISFTEFSYQLLQAHDFWTLHKEKGCRLQIGGSDQWGNIVAGIDLIRRRRGEAPEPVSEPEEIFGLTIPLLTTPAGEKFGKSAGNAVWLDPSMTSVFDFYQYFVRASDAMVGQLLAMFTLMPVEDVASLMTKHEANPGERLAQRALAKEVTELVHGVDAVRQAEAATAVLFDTDVAHVRADDVVEALRGDPRLAVVPRNAAIGIALTKLMADHSIAKSRSEAQKVLKAGGFYLNSVKVTDAARKLEVSDPVNDRMVILRMGADNHLVIVLEEEETCGMPK